MRIVVLGASGMLGSTAFNVFNDYGYEVYGTVRSRAASERLRAKRTSIIEGVTAENMESINEVFARVKPDVAINCMGIVKQDSNAQSIERVLPVNSIFPHRLASACKFGGIRMIHISTDCVFSGQRGNYSEEDIKDACDLYGISKGLGEVDDASGPALTLRTSVVGHELNSSRSLIDWFLANQKSSEVQGYENVFYNGLSTVEVCKVVRMLAEKSEWRSGLLNLSGERISKGSLLRIVNEVYESGIQIQSVAEPVLNRTLDSSKFRELYGYSPPSWHEQIAELRLYKEKYLNSSQS